MKDDTNTTLPSREELLRRIKELEAALATERENARSLHQADQSRINRERHRSALLDAVTQAFCIIDLEGVVIDANETMAESFGLRREAFLGRSMHDLVDEDTFAERTPKFELARETRRPVRFVDSRAGRAFDININPIPDDEGEIGSFAIFAQELTDLRQIADELREAEERFQATFERAPIGVAHVMPDGVIVRCNPSFASMLGYKRSELLGFHYLDLTHSADREASRKNFEQLMKGGLDATVIEKRYVRKDGSIIWCDLSTTALRDADGSPRYVIAAVLDITHRKWAMDALKTSELRFRTAFQTSPDAIHILLLDSGRYVEINDGFTAFTGYEEHEVCGKLESDIDLWVDPGQRERFRTSLAAEGRVANLEARFRRKDGEIVTGLVSAAIIDIGGESHILAITRDVTQVRAFQAELKASQERYQLAVEGASDGIWDWDLLERSIYYSPRWKEILGYADDELPNTLETLTTRLHPDDEARVVAAYQDCASGLVRQFEIEFRMRAKDGSYRWILCRGASLRDSRGAAYRLAGAHTDITERKKAEAELSRTKARLEHLLRLAQLMEEPTPKIIDFALKGAIALTRSNVGLFIFLDEMDRLAVWTFSQGDWEARPDSIPHARLEKSPLWTMLRDRRTPEIFNDLAPFGVQLPDGHPELTRCMAVPVIDEGKLRIMALVGNKAEDYDDLDLAQFTLFAEGAWNAIRRRRAREELMTAKEAAEAANRTKSEFLANMSHEVRTPISGIIGMTEMTLQTELNQTQKRYLEMIREQATSLLGILNDILDFSKIEARKLDIRPTPFSLRQTIQSVAHTFLVEARAKGLELSAHIPDDVPDELVGDAGRLGQVLKNLVSNAIKFTDAGSVRLEVAHREAEGEVECLFAVADTGQGIASERQHLLFQDFGQLDTSYTKRYPGTGLGLAISKRLVELMGGSIGVESVPGQGSTFSFTARFQRTPPDQTDADRAEGTDAKRTLRILLAEDNHVNQIYIEHFLQEAGHEVTIAETGRAALDRLEEQPFDLVLMDVQMPEMDGLEATRLIRAHDGSKYRADIPIAALTALAMKGDRERILAAGMDAYLSKPVDLEELLRVVVELGGESGRPA